MTDKKKDNDISRNIQVGTLTASVSITSTDPNDSMEKLKKIAEEIMNTYEK